MHKDQYTRHFLVAINPGAGDQADEALKAELRTRIPEQQLDQLVMLKHSKYGLEPQLLKLAKICAETGAVLVVAGGDGTLNAALKVLMKQPVTLGVIPRGTFNFFARDRQIPEQTEAAIEVLLQGAEREFPLASVNGYPFCVSASLGVYPKIIAAREQVSAITGRNRLVSLLSGVWVFLTRARGRRLVLAHDGARHTETAPMLLASVSPNQLGNFDLPEIDRIRQGGMLVFVMRSDSLLSLLSYLWASIRGQLHKLEKLDYFITRGLQVSTRRQKVTLAIDGELHRLSTPLKFSMQPNAYRCLVPAETESGEDRCV